MGHLLNISVAACALSVGTGSQSLLWPRNWRWVRELRVVSSLFCDAAAPRPADSRSCAPPASLAPASSARNTARCPVPCVQRGGWCCPCPELRAVGAQIFLRHFVFLGPNFAKFVCEFYLRSDFVLQNERKQSRTTSYFVKVARHFCVGGV